MKYIKCVVLCTTLICLLCACTKGDNNLLVETSPENKTIIELATQVYSNSQLTTIAQFEGTINELSQAYSIDCVRSTQNGYRVSFLGEQSVAIIQFNNDGDKIIGNVHKLSLMSCDYEWQSSLKTLDDIQKIDPNGEFLFLYAGRNDIPKISSHYTKDGYIVIIEYNDNNQIVNITQELI